MLLQNLIFAIDYHVKVEFPISSTFHISLKIPPNLNNFQPLWRPTIGTARKFGCPKVKTVDSMSTKRKKIGKHLIVKKL